MSRTLEEYERTRDRILKDYRLLLTDNSSAEVIDSARKGIILIQADSEEYFSEMRRGVKGRKLEGVEWELDALFVNAEENLEILRKENANHAYHTGDFEERYRSITGTLYTMYHFGVEEATWAVDTGREFQRELTAIYLSEAEREEAKRKGIWRRSNNKKNVIKWDERRALLDRYQGMIAKQKNLYESRAAQRSNGAGVRKEKHP